MAKEKLLCTLFVITVHTLICNLSFVPTRCTLQSQALTSQTVFNHLLHQEGAKTHPKKEQLLHVFSTFAPQEYSESHGIIHKYLWKGVYMNKESKKIFIKCFPFPTVI